jgi:hypothetical protein
MAIPEGDNRPLTTPPPLPLLGDTTLNPLDFGGKIESWDCMTRGVVVEVDDAPLALVNKSFFNFEGEGVALVSVSEEYSRLFSSCFMDNLLIGDITFGPFKKFGDDGLLSLGDGVFVVNEADRVESREADEGGCCALTLVLGGGGGGGGGGAIPSSS